MRTGSSRPRSLGRAPVIGAAVHRGGTRAGPGSSTPPDPLPDLQRPATGPSQGDSVAHQRPLATPDKGESAPDRPVGPPSAPARGVRCRPHGPPQRCSAALMLPSPTHRRSDQPRFGPHHGLPTTHHPPPTRPAARQPSAVTPAARPGGARTPGSPGPPAPVPPCAGRTPYFFNIDLDLLKGYYQLIEATLTHGLP